MFNYLIEIVSKVPARYSVEGKVNIKILTFGSGLPPTRGLVPLAILPPLGERMVERPVWILESSGRKRESAPAQTTIFHYHSLNHH
jgi:hypothetical protein